MSPIALGAELVGGDIKTLPPPIDGVCVNAAETLNVLNSVSPALYVVVPGAFTPTCSERHVPAFLTQAGLQSLKLKGIKSVTVLSVDNPFVMRAWAQDLIQRTSNHESATKAFQSGYLRFASDAGGQWLKTLGLANENANDPFTKDGIRGIRSAFVVGETKKIEYIGVDTKRGSVEYSGIDGVLNGWNVNSKL